jgi:hypothetical protein
MRTLSVLFLASAGGWAGDLRLGKPFQLKSSVTIEQLVTEPAKYAGQTVQVKGKVTEVCQMMGCWMQLVDPASGKSVRIKVNDGEIVFPKEAAGKMATAEGKFTRIQLTREQAVALARHEAEEQGRPFKPESVTGPAVIYQIHGSGAVLEMP